MIHLEPIYERKFRKIAKGCGIKYQNKIPNRELRNRELKAMLGYRPLDRKREFDIRDEEGFVRVFDNM